MNDPKPTGKKVEDAVEAMLPNSDPQEKDEVSDDGVDEADRRGDDALRDAEEGFTA